MANKVKNNFNKLALEKLYVEYVVRLVKELWDSSCIFFLPLDPRTRGNKYVRQQFHTQR